MNTTEFINVNEPQQSISSKPFNESDPRYTFRYFGLTIGFWTVFVGSIGNALTILTYIANRKLRTTFNLLLLNLAVVDFYTAVFMIPFNIAAYVQLEWPFGNDSVTARLQAFNYFNCGYTSVVFLLVIAVNRFIGALFPGKYKIMFKRRRMIWILLMCYTVAPIFLLPSLVGTDPDCNTPNNAITGFYTAQIICTFVCSTPGWNPYMQIVRVLFQFLPLIVMIVIYSIIFVSVSKKRSAIDMRMASSTMSKASPSKSEVGSIYKSNEAQKLTAKRTRSMSVQHVRRRREDSRMLMLSVMICVGFMITFIPSVIVNLLPNRRELDNRWHMAASNLAWLNSSLNPVIYVIMNRSFRKEYWRIIRIGLGILREKFVHESTAGSTGGFSANSIRGKRESETEKL